MDPLSNIQRLTDAVDKLTQKVNELDSAVLKVGQDAATSFQTATTGVAADGGQRQLGTGRGNVMGSSLAKFSTPTPTTESMGGQPGQMGGAPGVPGGPEGPTPPTGGPGGPGGPPPPGGNRLSKSLATTSAANFMDKLDDNAGLMQMGIGVAQLALAPVAGAYAAAMPTAGVVDRATSYYQAIRNTGSNLSRASVEQATFNAMRGGMTGVGSDAVVSNILANAGFMPNTKNYLGLTREVAGAAINMGMENSVAANALPQLSGMNVANQLFNMGIMTLDAQGNQRSSAAISMDLMNRLFPMGATPQDIAREKSYQSLQTQLAGFNITGDLADIMMRNMSVGASGMNPDLSVNTNQANNASPLTAIFQTNQSQTGVQQLSEANVLSGMQTAANVVTQFNNAFGETIAAMSKYRAMLELGLSTNAGQGIATGISTAFSGIKNIVGGVLKFLPFVGGGTPGFGGSFGAAKFGTPSAISTTDYGVGSVSAGYGISDDSGSGIWSSTGNIHKGTDYNAKVGTPVRATLDGVVSNQILSSDYGQALVIDHPIGYSTIYAHLKSKDVSPGTRVKAGDVIGKSGQSGNTTGPSLHYEVQKGRNNPVDPSELMRYGALEPISNSSLAQVKQPSSIPTGVPTGSYNASAAEMKKWLMSQGLSESGAFGVVANLVAESNLRTGALGDGGTSYGIAQWRLGRRDNLIAFAKEKGLEANSIEAQQQFLMYELNDYGSLLSMLKDPNTTNYDATKEFMVKFERPKDQSENAVASRYNKGLGALGAKGGGTPGYGGGFSQTSTGPSIANVNINLTIANASDAEAHLFAIKVKEILSNDKSLSKIGSS